MDTKSVALAGVKPKDLLDTAFGISMVYTELGRIEHGIFDDSLPALQTSVHQ